MMKMHLEETQILSERLRRQFLTAPVKVTSGYLDAFRRLQPVSPVFFSCPGAPPALSDRTVFDDGLAADRLRLKRRIVKGRFLGGGIGYVLAEDLSMYANAFRRPLTGFTETQAEVYRSIRATGPLTPRQIKDETRLLNKQIAPALHRLQCAFLVFEDQIDSDWERAWHDFQTEWPGVELDEAFFGQCIGSVLQRFFAAHVFATFEQVKDWSHLPSKSLITVLDRMEATGLLTARKVSNLGEGWLAKDAGNLKYVNSGPTAFMLHKADYLARSHASELKRRFGSNDVLQYLLIDGQFHGAVLGHWRIGPHDVSDIAITLPKIERVRRRDEILALVSQKYRQPHSRIMKYDGKALRNGIRGAEQ